jgi:nucleotide-binding universal stress UspA family protein
MWITLPDKNFRLSGILLENIYYNLHTMKTIIIPTDFLPVATNAMHYGLDMAKAIDATVLLFHAYSVPISMMDAPVILVSVEDLEKSAKAQITALKEKVDHITSGQVIVETDTRLGDTVDELEALCDRIQPFAVIMGTSDSSGIEQSLFGSNTMSAIHRLKWPIIAMPPGRQYGKGIRKIGFACDFKKVVETTPAGVIKDVAKQFNAELHVLNVDYNNKNFTDDIPRQNILLQSMLQEVNPQYDFIQHEDVEEGINEFAEKNNLDLLIIIPKKHTLLEGLFKKSATKKLVFHSHVPVMCIHE